MGFYQKEKHGPVLLQPLEWVNINGSFIETMVQIFFSNSAFFYKHVLNIAVMIMIIIVADIC